MEWMFMPLKRYADFSGRSRRMEFWMWELFQFLHRLRRRDRARWRSSAAALMIAGGDPTALMAAGGAVMIIGVLYVLFALAFFIPRLAVTVRRLHDTDRSGWWMLRRWRPYLADDRRRVDGRPASPDDRRRSAAIIGAGRHGRGARPRRSCCSSSCSSKGRRARTASARIPRARRRARSSPEPARRRAGGCGPPAAALGRASFFVPLWRNW